MSTIEKTPTAPAPEVPSGPSEGAEPRFTRLSVNVTLDVADAIRSITRRKGISATEGVRRAIAIWKLVEDAVEDGGTVQVVSSTGKARELVLL